jgi:outer membrane protein assembly factor BamB
MWRPLGHSRGRILAIDTDDVLLWIDTATGAVTEGERMKGCFDREPLSVDEEKVALTTPWWVKYISLSNGKTVFTYEEWDKRLDPETACVHSGVFYVFWRKFYFDEEHGLWAIDDSGVVSRELLPAKSRLRKTEFHEGTVFVEFVRQVGEEPLPHQRWLSLPHYLLAVDLATGRELWRTQVTEWFSRALRKVRNSIVLVRSRKVNFDPEDPWRCEVLPVDARTGEVGAPTRWVMSPARGMRKSSD